MGDKELLHDMGRRINARRLELHLTQEQVAEQMEVSTQMISNLELGRKAIRPENFLKLCRVLDVSADFILSGRYSDTERSEVAKKYALLSPEHQRIIGELIDSLAENRQQGSLSR